MLSLTEEVLWGSDNNTRSLLQSRRLLSGSLFLVLRQPLGPVTRAESSARYPLLGPGVVAAALQAGVPHANLAAMQGLLAQGGKINKTKDINTGVTLEAFTDEELMTDQEMKPAEQGSGLQGQHSVGLTLQKLTSIVELLTEDKKKRTAQSKLETALDGSAAASSDLPLHGTGKKAAAARRALRSADDDVDDDDDARSGVDRPGSGTMAAELALEPRLR